MHKVSKSVTVCIVWLLLSDVWVTTSSPSAVHWQIEILQVHKIIYAKLYIIIAWVLVVNVAWPMLFAPTEIILSSCQIWQLKCTKFYFCWGFAPDPTGGTYGALPDLLAWFGGGEGERKSCVPPLFNSKWRQCCRLQISQLLPSSYDSSCGLAAYTNLPSDMWQFEQLTTAIFVEWPSWLDCLLSFVVLSPAEPSIFLESANVNQAGLWINQSEVPSWRGTISSVLLPLPLHINSCVCLLAGWQLWHTAEWWHLVNAFETFYQPKQQPSLRNWIVIAMIAVTILYVAEWTWWSVQLSAWHWTLLVDITTVVCWWGCHIDLICTVSSCQSTMSVFSSLSTLTHCCCCLRQV